MATIQLVDGGVALVSECDAPLLSQQRWRLTEGYVRSSRGQYMHRVVLGAPKGVEVDHRDGDPLNNQRCNLRLATRAEQSRNSHVGWGRSKYKGVIWNKARQAWIVRIKRDGVSTYLGLFRDEIEAAKAYNAAAIERFGAFACGNVIDGYTNEREQAKPNRRRFTSPAAGRHPELRQKPQPLLQSLQ